MSEHLSDLKKHYSLFDQSDRQILCRHWTKKREALQQQIMELQLELLELEAQLRDNGCESILNGLSVKLESLSNDQYDRRSTWKEKAQYILHMNNKPMTSREITDEIFQREYLPGETKDGAKKRHRKIMTSVSGILSDGTRDQVKNPAIFRKLDRVNPDNEKELSRFWLAGENLISD